MPTVRIVADYASNGYILVDDAARSFATLPVDDELLDRLARWADAYDAHCDPLAYEDVSGQRFDFVAFAAAGFAIACAVKRTLPHWTVTYFDEAMDWFSSRDPRHYTPARAEYEITLNEGLAAGGSVRIPRNGDPAT